MHKPKNYLQPQIDFRIMRIFLGFLFLGIVSSDDAYAVCNMSRAPKLNYFSNFQTKTYGQFMNSGGATESVFINKCEGGAGQVLMLSLAVSRPGIYSDIMDISLDGSIGKSQCNLIDLPTEPKIFFEDNARFLADSLRAFRTCFSIRVVDPTGNPISYKKNQPNCLITPNAPNEIDLNGNYCFLRIRPTSQFIVSLHFNEMCLDQEFLIEKKIMPQDYQAVLNAYVAGDDSGLSTEINPIGSRSIRWYMSAPAGLFPLTESGEQENLQFPAEYNVDIHPGEFKATQTSLGINLYSSFFVRNLARLSCRENICAAPANYIQPVFGEFELLKTVPGKKDESLDIWYSGGWAGPLWEGLIKSPIHLIRESVLEEGQTYLLSVTFTDPFDDFVLFLNWTKQLLVDISRVGGLAGISTIEPIAGLRSIGLLPQFPALPHVADSSNEVSFKNALEQLERMIGSRVWPNTFEKICSSDRDKCETSAGKKYHTKIEFKFKAKNKDPASGVWLLSDQRIVRYSQIFGFYEKEIKRLPTLFCKEEFR